MSAAVAGDFTILAFKAGRAHRREGTNWVDPSPTKGAVLLCRGADDELLHFRWQNRATNEFEEDLILFPMDAEFTKVSQSAWGRTYVLKFSSSNQRHFFWLQDASSRRDEEFVRHINNLLRDPDYIPIWDTTLREPEAAASGSQPSSQASLVSAGSQPTEEQLAQLRALVASMSGGVSSNQPELSLTDVLTPTNIAPLFTAHPELIHSLFPHLPSDLPVPPSPEVLQRIIESPQFQSAVRSFDQALHTGLLGGLVRGLGLPDEAGTGVGPFLRAIQEQARSGEGGSGGGAGQDAGNERMDTD